MSNNVYLYRDYRTALLKACLDFDAYLNPGDLLHSLSDQEVLRAVQRITDDHLQNLFECALKAGEDFFCIDATDWRVVAALEHGEITEDHEDFDVVSAQKAEIDNAYNAYLDRISDLKKYLKRDFVSDIDEDLLVNVEWVFEAKLA